MTFRTSSNKINPALNLFRFSLKKNTGTSVIISIIAFIVCPVFGISFITSTRIFDMFDGEIDLSIYAMVSFVLISLLAILTALILTITNFNYLYSRQGGDLFYALPLSRTEMFFARFFSIYTSSLFVTVLPYIGLSLLPVFGNVSLDLGLVWKTFLISAVMLFLTCAFFALFAIFSGGIFNFLVAGVTYCTTVIIAGTYITNWLSQFTLGLNVFSTMFSGLWLNKIVRLIPCADYIVQLFRINPLFEGSPIQPNYLNADPTEQTLHFILVDVLIYLFAGIIIMILALFIYRKRKTEKVGESYVFSFVKACVCICIAFVCASLLGSTFSIFDTVQFSVFFWIFALLGALIGGTGTYAIISRGFKKFWKGILAGALAFVFLFSTFTFTKIKGKADSKYVPPVERIAEAQLSIGTFPLNFGNKKDITEFHKLITESIPEGDVFKLNDSTLISAEKPQNDNMYNPTSFFGYISTDFGRNYLPLTFEYTFDNGQRLERKYKLDYFWNLDFLQNILFSDNVINRFEKAEFESYVALYNATGETMLDMPEKLSSQDFIKLYKTLAEEFKDYKGKIDKEKAFFIEVNFSIIEKIKKPYEDYNIRYVNFPLMIPSEFENTIQLLSELQTKEKDSINAFLNDIILPLTAYAPEAVIYDENEINAKDLVPFFKAACAIAKEDTEKWLNEENGKYEVPEDQIASLMSAYYGGEYLNAIQNSKDYNPVNKTLTVDTFDLEGKHSVDAQYFSNNNGVITTDVNYYIDGRFIMQKHYTLLTDAEGSTLHIYEIIPIEK